MLKYVYLLCCLSVANCLHAQDTSNTEIFDASLYMDATNEQKFCTQKVINQTPTKLISIGYEHNLGFKNEAPSGSYQLSSMGGLRTSLSILAFSTNKLIVSLGASYWGTKIQPSTGSTNQSLSQVYQNRMDIEGLNALVFKPLNERHFIIVQANADAAHIGMNNTFHLSRESLTFYGSALFGWKKGDYSMFGIGASRTYRMGRPIIVPIVLYNKTFNEQWGIETLLPARAHLRYNFSPNRMLLMGYELEGQQYALEANNQFLQRGEIKPRLVFEQKLIGFFWLSAQAGYRINGRFNFVNQYDGQEEDEVFVNKWGGSPFFNLSINFVSP
jgi:hypothetical protein